MLECKNAKEHRNVMPKNAALSRKAGMLKYVIKPRDRSIIVLLWKNR